MNKEIQLDDLDYFITFNHIVYLVKGPYHPHDYVFAYPVFWPEKSGDRIHPRFGNFKKDVSDLNEKIFIIHPEYRHNNVPFNTPLVPHNHIIEIFKPRERIPSFLKEEEKTVWHKIFFYLTDNLKIPKDDVGIFGSYLVELHKNKKGEQIKDVDFVIYGLDNFLKVKNGIEKLLHYFGFSHISQEHINYHVQKFGSLFDPTVNSFAKTLANKWSSIQIKPGILNTLRFVYKPEERPENPITSEIEKPIQLKGVVEDDAGTNFMPRIFTLNSQNKRYRIVTYFWAFQSCVKNGDHCLITGNLHKDGQTVSIDGCNHGIKIL